MAVASACIHADEPPSPSGVGNGFFMARMFAVIMYDYRCRSTVSLTPLIFGRVDRHPPDR